MPLIGTLDSARTQVVMESLLQQIVQSGAGLAIMQLDNPIQVPGLLSFLAYGTFHALVVGVSKWAYQVLGLEAPPLDANFWSLETLRGSPQAVSSVLAVHVDSVLFAFFGIMMFLVLRVLITRTWPAVAAWCALAASASG